MAVNKLALLCVGCHLLCFVAAQVRFGCQEDHCTKNAAPCEVPDECENGILFKNATECGCCHICVKYKKENEYCEEKVQGSFPYQICGPMLTCKGKKCVKVDTQCVKDLEKFEKRLEDPPIDRTEPKCDDLGLYSSTVCISDVLCYCVNENGTRIFGTDVASRKDNMDCSCSREYEMFSKKMQFDKGGFLRCRPNGDYDILQCTEKSCYCMTEYDGEIDVEDISNAHNLKCYSRRHKTEGEDKNLRSKCWRERESLLNQIKDYETEELSVIGVDIPECDLDGSYAPVQSKKNTTYCVSRDGKILEETVVLRNSEHAKKMNCRCARDTEMLRNEKVRNENMNVFARFKCSSNGNYERKQKDIQGLEIIVDEEMGYQI